MASEGTGADASEEAGPDPGRGRSKAVLYIEDNLANLRLVQEVLAYRPSVNLVSAMEGRVGVDLAIKDHPDLILLDLDLPDIPGEEVFRRLKAEATTDEIPIVIVSADASPETVRRLEALGADRFLTKPLNLELFLRTVDELLA
jgi:CheY-like chemotaxis protein